MEFRAPESGNLALRKVVFKFFIRIAPFLLTTLWVLLGGLCRFLDYERPFQLVIDADEARFYPTFAKFSGIFLVLRVSVKASDTLNFSLLHFKNRHYPLQIPCCLQKSNQATCLATSSAKSRKDVQPIVA